MNNKFKLKKVLINKNRIDYDYEIEGDWINCFNLSDKFFVEYNCDISKVPVSIAVIPLLCNILPLSWICDAKIELDTCDRDFFESIENFKKGYKEMYPMIDFRGKIVSNHIEENKMQNDNGAMSFFSGGVDAFNTLLNHLDEKPTLVTLWGADIKLNDEEGWSNVLNHIQLTAEEYNLDYIIIRSNLKTFITHTEIDKKIKGVRDEWWHGFQHGIGIISHAAPIAFLNNKRKIYFASSFTSEDKGKITCASDPTIDNFLKMSKINVIHDGYEFHRQDKVHNIIQYTNKMNKEVKLRVCWQENKGENCCQCEKCWRTILEIIAENEDPKKYGLNFTDKQLKNFHKLYFYDNNIPPYRRKVYLEAQEKMRENVNYDKLPKELKWFYNININKLGHHPIFNITRKIKNKAVKLIRSMKG